MTDAEHGPETYIDDDLAARLIREADERNEGWRHVPAPLHVRNRKRVEVSPGVVRWVEG